MFVMGARRAVSPALAIILSAGLSTGLGAQSLAPVSDLSSTAEDLSLIHI